MTRLGYYMEEPSYDIAVKEAKYSIWLKFQDWLFRPGNHAWKPLKNELGESIFRINMHSKKRKKIFKCQDCEQIWMRKPLLIQKCDVFKLPGNHDWHEIFDKNVGVSLGFICRKCEQEWNTYRQQVQECDVFRVMNV